MSYSRWLHSPFYTYWLSSQAKSKEEEVFACHVDLASTYYIKYPECVKALEDDKVIIDIIGDDTPDKEIGELRGYIKDFVSDIDTVYKHGAK